MKGRGTAVIRFTSERDAQRAVGILFKKKNDCRLFESFLNN